MGEGVSAVLGGADLGSCQVLASRSETCRQSQVTFEHHDLRPVVLSGMVWSAAQERDVELPTDVGGAVVIHDPVGRQQNPTLTGQWPANCCRR